MHPLWKERHRPSTPPATDEQIVRSLQPHLLFHLTPHEKFAHVGPGGRVRRIVWSWACLFEVFWRRRGPLPRNLGRILGRSGLDFWVSLCTKSRWPDVGIKAPKITSAQELHIPPGTFVQLRRIAQVSHFTSAKFPQSTANMQSGSVLCRPTAEKQWGFGGFFPLEYYYY